jgi:hypothetical protein
MLVPRVASLNIAVVLMRLQKWLVVAALVLSIGGHWAFLQSVAWVGMAVDYSKDTSLSQALEKTFDGHHLCKLCKIVRAGKKAENAKETKIEFKKFDLVSGSPTFFVFQSPSAVPEIVLGPSLQRTEAPLLPPPLFV